MSGGANLVQWFEIPVSDLVRATAFYEKVLGVSFTPLEQHGLRMAWFPTVDGGEGSGGAVVQGEGRTPGRAGTLVYFTVADALEAGQRRGVVDRDVNTRDAAVLLVTMIEGILSLAKNSQDPEVLRVGARNLRTVLATLRAR